MQPTPEQKDVIDFWREKGDDQHLLINARAGTGKTTLSVWCAEAVYEQTGGRCVLLTYSKMLKTETRNKTKKQDYVVVESFHSLVNNIFETTCHDNRDLEQFLDHPTSKSELKNVHLLIVDEVQDLTDSYVRLIQHLQTQVHPDCRLMLIGDRFQNIFQSLQQSSTRFMDEPEAYFGGSFARKRLSCTHRMTPEIARWVNKNVDPLTIEKHYPDQWTANITEAWGSGMSSSRKPGEDVETYTFQFFRDHIPSKLICSLQQLIRKHGASELLFLVGSTKLNKRHPVRWILNLLNCRYICLGDTELDPQVAQDKVLISTPYKMKGREAAVVVFCGFDSFLEKVNPEASLSHALAYVASTRAKEKLIVLTDSGQHPLFTIREAKVNVGTWTPKHDTPTKLASYLPYQALTDSILATEVTPPPGSDCKEVSGFVYWVNGSYENLRSKFLAACVKVRPHLPRGTKASSIDWSSLLDQTGEELEQLLANLAPLKGTLKSGTHEGISVEAFVDDRSVFTVTEGTSLFHQHVALLNKAVLAKDNPKLEFAYLLAPFDGRLLKVRHAFLDDGQYILAMKKRKAPVHTQ